MSHYAIETRQLTKFYGNVPALNNVNLHVQRGIIYGLIGDNGAGKSTLLKLLAGHVFADSGEIRLFGHFEEKALRQCRRQMGAIIEQPGFFPNMTVEHTLEYYRIQRGIPGKEKVEEILRLTDIYEKRKCKCKKLSLGQKQRLGLAVALIGEPQLLILDEPSNGLDPSGTAQLRRLLCRLNEEKKITVLISSHILSELQLVSTVFGFLNNGTLLEEITAEKLQEKCTDFLEIAVSDAEEYAALLARCFPDESFRVLPDRQIRISSPRRESETFSRLATDNGLYIRRLEKSHASLEDYYMNLKKGGNGKC